MISCDLEVFLRSFFTAIGDKAATELAQTNVNECRAITIEPS